MSAKKSAAKKSSKSPKKTAAKKAAPKKTTASKAAPKKRVKKEAASKATKRSAAKEAKAAAETPAKTTANGSANGERRVRRAAALHRDKRHTPPIFKLPSRRQAPIVFTLEDVREHLAKRKKDESAAAAEKTAEEAKKTAVPASTAGTTPTDGTPKSGKRAAASLDDILGFATGGAPRGGEVPKKWKRYHELLVELRDSVKNGLMQHSNDTLKRSQKEDAGDISTSADAGTDNFDRDFALSLLSSEQEALKEIEAAIRRIHNGTYGVCEITGEPIAEERLEAVPFTRYSLEGQRQHEATARRKSNRGGAVFAESTADISFGGDDDGDN
ncbi:MAG: TraR/DksA C4-type zinc finger protein [Opitutales bacterium]|nr:TraR/DksA C4-type zinc finger protein [Opitutales bacterium]